MKLLFGLALTTLVGCSDAYAGAPPAEKAASMPAPNPKVTNVEIAAVTLGDDCGAPSRAKAESKRAAVAADRACERTSMQLSVRLGDGLPPATLQVKSVELFTAAGASLGVLTPSAPRVWDGNGVYQAWDQKLSSTRQAIAYELSTPNWSKVADRHSGSFVLKVVVTVGGADRALQREINLSAPTMLPPNVAT